MEKDKKTKGSCFVIMPFGGWFDKYYRDIFFEAIKDSDLDAKRADDLYRSSPIINDIWELTKNATVILADLTGKNPNVFYELGLAHAIQKPAILVTETMDDVPFDLRALRVIVYDKRESDWGNKLKVKISSSIKETIESPISRVLPTFLNVDETLTKEITFGQKEFLALKYEVDLLRTQISKAKPDTFYLPSNTFEIDMTIKKLLDKGSPIPYIITYIESFFDVTIYAAKYLVEKNLKSRKNKNH